MDSYNVQIIDVESITCLLSFEFLSFNFLNNMPKKAFDSVSLSFTLELYLFKHLIIDLT